MNRLLACLPAKRGTGCRNRNHSRHLGAKGGALGDTSSCHIPAEGSAEHAGPKTLHSEPGSLTFTQQLIQQPLAWISGFMQLSALELAWATGSIDSAFHVPACLGCLQCFLSRAD